MATDIALPVDRSHPGQEEFLRTLFAELRRDGVRYCVVHSSNTLPRCVSNDLDLAVSGIDIAVFEDILVRVATNCGWKVVQLLWYDVPMCRYYVVKSGRHEKCFAAVDVVIDERGIGGYGFDSVTLTSDGIDNGQFVVSAPEVEFCYKITKRIRKGFFKPEDSSLLARLYADGDKQRIWRLLKPRFGKRGAGLICEMAATGAITSGTIRVRRYFSLVREVRRYVNPGIQIRRAVWQLRRICFRVVNPAGLILYIPDMTESNLTRFGDILAQCIGPAFRSVQIERNPGWIKRLVALSGSRLIICPVEKLRVGIRIQSGVIAGLTARALEGSSTRAGDEMEILVRTSESGILDTLHDRMRRRLRGVGET